MTTSPSKPTDMPKKNSETIWAITTATVVALACLGIALAGIRIITEIIQHATQH